MDRSVTSIMATGDAATVRLLLSTGFVIIARHVNRSGETPLHLLAMNAPCEDAATMVRAAEALVAAGVSPDARDRTNMTALELALYRRDGALARYLWDKTDKTCLTTREHMEHRRRMARVSEE